jgi:ABC-type protease/lipase transport system fused ATPase/permease subunit
VPYYLAIVFLLHPLLGVVALIGACLLFALALLSELRTRAPLQWAGTEIAAANAFAEAGLANAEAVRSMGMLPGIRRLWHRRHETALVLQCLTSDRAGTLAAASKAMRMALQMGILAAGAALVIDQAITPGTMFAASILMGRALAPVEQAIGSWRQFVNARSAWRRVSGLLAAYPEKQQEMSLPPPRGMLSVERVTVIPPGGQIPVLKNVTFTLAPGESLGVIGPSAAGKSTLATDPRWRLATGIRSGASGRCRTHPMA